MKQNKIIFGAKENNSNKMVKIKIVRVHFNGLGQKKTTENSRGAQAGEKIPKL